MIKGGKKIEKEKEEKKRKKTKKVNLRVKVSKTASKKKISPKASIEKPQKKAKVGAKRKKTVKPKKEKKIAGKEIESEIRSRILYEKVERKKQFIMWVGVTFFMILIAIAWIYSIKQVFQETQANKDKDAISSWDEITNELSGKIEKMKEDIGEIKSFGKISDIKIASSSISSTTLEKLKEKIEEKATSSSEFETDEVTGGEIGVLKKKIEELEKKLENTPRALPAGRN